MYGGFVIIPQNCTATISLRYYVPNIVHPEALTQTSASAAAITSADNPVARYEAPQG